jgi:two-component system NtrC family sensor kinase
MYKRSSCILVVDHEPATVDQATQLLHNGGFDVRTAAPSAPLSTLLEGSSPTLLLLAGALALPDNAAGLRQVRMLMPHIPVILLLDPADSPEAQAALLAALPAAVSLGIQGMVWKPLEDATLHQTVLAALEQDQRRQEGLELRQRAMMQYAADAVFLIDEYGKQILDANPAAERMSGYTHEELLQFAPHELLTGLVKTRKHNSDTPPYPLLLDDVYGSLSNPEKVSSALRMKNGRSLPVSASISRIPADEPFLLVIVRDMSNGWRMTQQLVQQEKLAAVGRLISSVAHEINNPLQAIHNSLHLLITRSHNGDLQKRERYLMMAQNEVEHLIGIVQRVLEIYRPAREGMRPTDLHEVLQAALTLLGHRLETSGIQVVFEWNPRPLFVYGISSHLKQVCISLILNAMESMPESGTLTLRTSVTDATIPEGEMTVGRPIFGPVGLTVLQDPASAPADEAEEGTPEVIVVEFSDTGRGIPPEDLPKMFEPFYTTRNNSIGLGLAISYGIVEQHNGKITVTSEVGSGTTLRLYLPAATTARRTHP